MRTPHLIVPLLGLLACTLQGVRGQGEVPSFLFSLPSALKCQENSIQALGADPTGVNDAADIFTAANGLALTYSGIIFVPRGTYAIRKSISLQKTVQFESGAVLDIDGTAVVTFDGLLSAGDQRIFKGPGAGSVLFLTTSNPAVRPEWWGARGDGVTDDSAAIRTCFAAAALSSAEVFFSNKTYGLGSTLVRAGNMRIYSEPGATFVALKADLTGLRYAPMDGGVFRPDRLPIFRGFHTALFYDDIGATDSYVPLITDGSFPCKNGMRFNGDSTRVKYGTILNCETGIWITTEATREVMQGFQIEGDEFRDEKNVAKQLYLWTARLDATLPYWDHNVLFLRKLSVHPRAQNFAAIRSTPRTLQAMNLFEIQDIGSLPPGNGNRFIDTWQWDTQYRLGNVPNFKEGQLNFPDLVPGNTNSQVYGNTFILRGPNAVAAAKKQLTLSTAPFSLASFKKMNGLTDAPWSNLLTIKVPQNNTVWRQGQTRIFYLYHQLAHQGTQSFFNLPGVGSKCTSNGYIAVTAITDNSDDQNANIRLTNSKYEVSLHIIACKTIPLTQQLGFQMSVGMESV